MWYMIGEAQRTEGFIRSRHSNLRRGRERNGMKGKGKCDEERSSVDSCVLMTFLSVSLSGLDP